MFGAERCRDKRATGQLGGTHGYPGTEGTTGPRGKRVTQMACGGEKRGPAMRAWRWSWILQDAPEGDEKR